MFRFSFLLNHTKNGDLDESFGRRFKPQGPNRDLEVGWCQNGRALPPALPCYLWLDLHGIPAFGHKIGNPFKIFANTRLYSLNRAGSQSSLIPRITRGCNIAFLMKMCNKWKAGQQQSWAVKGKYTHPVTTALWRGLCPVCHLKEGISWCLNISFSDSWWNSKIIEQLLPETSGEMSGSAKTHRTW